MLKSAPTNMLMTSPMPHLIEPQDLQTRLGSEDLIIVDLCNQASYKQQHIPGAIHLAGSQLTAGTPPLPGACPSLKQLTKVIHGLGIDSCKTVILYDDEGGGWAGRLAWTLDLLGLSNWYYLNGGMLSWTREGFTIENQINRPVSLQTNELIPANPRVRINAAQILAALGSADFAIWDARNPAEFKGEKVLAKRGGHIPGAINLEWTELMDPEKNLRIRDNAQQILNNLGLTKDKHIATHCQSHHRSSFTYMVARILGYEQISGYDGSWSEWGNLDNTPVQLGC